MSDTNKMVEQLVVKQGSDRIEAVVTRYQGGRAVVVPVTTHMRRSLEKHGLHIRIDGKIETEVDVVSRVMEAEQAQMHRAYYVMPTA